MRSLLVLPLLLSVAYGRNGNSGKVLQKKKGETYESADVTPYYASASSNTSPFQEGEKRGTLKKGQTIKALKVPKDKNQRQWIGFTLEDEKNSTMYYVKGYDLFPSSKNKVSNGSASVATIGSQLAVFSPGGMDAWKLGLLCAAVCALLYNYCGTADVTARQPIDTVAPEKETKSTPSKVDLKQKRRLSAASLLSDHRSPSPSPARKSTVKKTGSKARSPSRSPSPARKSTVKKTGSKARSPSRSPSPAAKTTKSSTKKTTAKKRSPARSPSRSPARTARKSKARSPSPGRTKKTAGSDLKARRRRSASSLLKD